MRAPGVEFSFNAFEFSERETTNRQRPTATPISTKTQNYKYKFPAKSIQNSGIFQLGVLHTYYPTPLKTSKTLRLLLKTGFRFDTHQAIMKYMEYDFDRLKNFLSNLLPLDTRTIEGCLEAYSCKYDIQDRIMNFVDGKDDIIEHLGKSSDATSSSSMEYLYSSSSRKTLIYLLLTLQQIYPDFIFSAVRDHAFFKEENWDSFSQIFDDYMGDASKEWLEKNEGGTLLGTLHNELDEIVKLSECEIYSYNPKGEADPFSEKRAINLRDDSSSRVDGEIFDGMDI